MGGFSEKQLSKEGTFSLKPPNTWEEKHYRRHTMSDIAHPDTAITAGLDTAAKYFRVLLKSGITLEQLMRPLDNLTARRNFARFVAAGCPKIELPQLNIMVPVFAINEHGHTTITFTGLDLSGAEEIERAVEQGNRVGDYAQSCLVSTNADSYDANHRLVAEQTYTVALMPNAVIEKNRDRSTEGLRQVGADKFGYAKPLAGIAPRIREALSDEAMEKLGFYYVAALHDPIADRGGYPSVLDAHRDDGGRWLDAYWGRPGRKWLTGGASALLVPAT
ncbi:MAG: hypothetical protein JWO58_3385 [Chitinophagaceae bacterium]|nr:hypothetical protein [Chitinophagaceae bacterium]